MKSKFTTKMQEVFTALVGAGDIGLRGAELKDITWRFGAAICALRREGHCIQTIRLTATDFRYIHVGSHIETPPLFELPSFKQWALENSERPV
jgi:hypothetical protein